MPEIKKIGHVIHISREMLLDEGLVEPTAGERATRERYAAEQDARIEAERRRRAEAFARLADLDDRVARAVLELHRADERGECRGCDVAGYEAEQPDWPCRTVETVAALFEISLA